MILLLLSFCLYCLTLILDRYTINFQFLLQNGILPGVIQTPIKEFDTNRNFCEDDYENVISNQYFSGVSAYDGSLNQFSIQRMPYNVYDNQNICIKRFEKDDKFSEIAEYKMKDEECSIGKRQCGLISKEFKNKFCLSKEIKCPINKIQFVRSNNELYRTISLLNYIDGKFEDPDHKFVSFKLGNSFLITYYNETSMEMPISFRIAVGTPCLDIDRFEWGDKKNIPPHYEDADQTSCYNEKLKNYYINDDKGYDQSYINNKLDSYNFRDFLQENDLYRILKKLSEEDEDYKFKFEEHDISFYYNSIVDIDSDCMKEPNVESHFDFNEYRDKIERRRINNFIRMSVFMGNMIFLAFTISFASIVKISMEEGFHKIFLVLKTFIQIGLGSFMVYYGFKIIQHTNYMWSEQLIILIRTNPECFISVIKEKWDVHEMENKIYQIDICAHLIAYLSIPYIIIVLIQTGRVTYKFYIYITTRNK